MILLVGFWTFLRAVFFGSAAVALENVALRHQLLGTPVPCAFTGGGKPYGRAGLTLRVMHWLVSRSLLPHEPEALAGATRFARHVLYMRSHWLRMPPHLLAPHLVRKALVRSSTPRPHG